MELGGLQAENGLVGLGFGVGLEVVWVWVGVGGFRVRDGA